MFLKMIVRRVECFTYDKSLKASPGLIWVSFTNLWNENHTTLRVIFVWSVRRKLTELVILGSQVNCMMDCQHNVYQECVLRLSVKLWWRSVSDTERLQSCKNSWTTRVGRIVYKKSRRVGSQFYDIIYSTWRSTIKLTILLCSILNLF